MCPFHPTQSTRKWKIMKQNYVAYNGLTAMAINYYSDFFPKYLRSLLTYYECKKKLSASLKWADKVLSVPLLILSI